MNGDCQPICFELTALLLHASRPYQIHPDSHRLHYHNHSDIFSIDDLKLLCQSYATESVLLLSPRRIWSSKIGEKQSIVVVVNPLIAQVAEYCFMGLNAAYVNVKHGNEGMQQGVLEGKYQPVFMSPESLFTVWKCGGKSHITLTLSH